MSSYHNIVGAQTVTVSDRSGWLKQLCINTAASGGTVTMYDNTAASGTKIGTITFPVSLTETTLCLVYQCKLDRGLTIVTTGADIDVTAIYS